MPEREIPPQNYYPGAKVQLAIRFEDFGSRLIPAAAKPKPHTQRGASKEPALEVKKAPSGNGYVLAAKGGTNAGGSPQDATTSSDNLTKDVGGIIPASATLRRQGVRDGDKLTIEIRYADFPIDPRAVRACAVKFFAGTVPAADFARGVSGGVRPKNSTEGSGGEPLNLIPDKWTDEAGQERTNLRFEGWVDDIETEFPEDDEPIVRLECSDNSRLLVDALAPPGLTIDGKKPIDEAVANYLASFPQFRGLGVEFRPTGVTIPTLDDALAKTAHRPQLGPAPSKGGDSKLTVFDYIVDVCGALGLIAHVESTRVVIEYPHTKYSNRYKPRSDDPWTGRILPSGRVLATRLLAYGRNVESMTLRRRFARSVPQNIEVRCYDCARKKTLVVRYPLKDDRVLRAPAGNDTSEKWLVIRVRGIKDEKTLRLVAQSYYESQARNELQVRVSTKNLASYGGGNRDPDLLDVMPGDPIDVGIDRDLIFTAGDVEEKTTSDAERYLKKLGYSGDFAKAYSESVNNIGLPKTFRVRTSQLQWSNEEGISLEFELVNYVEVRADASLPPGEEIQTPPASLNPVTVNVESE